MQQQLMHQMQQQQQPTMAPQGTFNTNTAITTHHIQQYLDENKSLILKILENQNSGKLRECAENQARLQGNLIYLAAIADSQPPPSPSSIYAAQAGMNYMQHQQPQQMVPHPAMAARSSSMFYGLQQPPYSAFHQQQASQSHLGISSAGGTAGTTPNFGQTNTGEGWQGASKVAGSSQKDDNVSTGSAQGHGGN